MVVLVVLLAYVARDPLPVFGLLAAGAGVVVGYGTGSLSALAGHQSVLGPAGLVGPPVQALGAWLGALSFLGAGVSCAAGARRDGDGDGERLGSHPGRPRAPWVVAVAFGATAALVVLGPSVSRGLLVRVGATILAAWVIRLMPLRLLFEVNGGSGRWGSRFVLMTGSASLVLAAVGRSLS